MPLSLLLLVGGELLLTTATFIKSHLTHCNTYYDIYSQVHHITLNNALKCSLKCYNLGAACPRFHFNESTQLCTLSVLNSATTITKSTQLFTSDDTHVPMVSYVTIFPFRLHFMMATPCFRNRAVGYQYNVACLAP